jgi:uncharacterized membrane protein YphA (DoxX/SURF4 family)
MFEAYCRENLGPLALRLALGLVCAYQGFDKITAAGGTRWTTTLPAGWQLTIAWSQFTAGAAILAGFRCREAAALVLVLTAGQMAWWYGWDLFHLPVASLGPVVVIVLMALALVFLGAGGLAVGAGRPAAARGKRR